MSEATFLYYNSHFDEMIYNMYSQYSSKFDPYLTPDFKHKIYKERMKYYNQLFEFISDSCIRESFSQIDKSIKYNGNKIYRSKYMKIYSMSDLFTTPLYCDKNYDVEKFLKLVEEKYLTLQGDERMFYIPKKINIEKYSDYGELFISTTHLSFENVIGCIKLKISNLDEEAVMFSEKLGLKNTDEETLAKEFPFYEDEKTLTEFNFKHSINLKPIYSINYSF